MPLLAFAKQRFDPHLALVERLLIGEGLLVPFRSMQIIRKKGTMDMPTSIAFGTLCFHRAGIAGGRICAILHLLCSLKAVRRTQHLSLRAVILVMDSIIGELSKSIVARALSFLGDGNVGSHMGILDGFDVLDCSIRR